jgi:hypothetical protein
MKNRGATFRSNVQLARTFWGELSLSARRALKELTEKHCLSLAEGDLQQLEGRWYITHAGLLHISERRLCHGIRTAVQKELSDPTVGRWVFKAIVYKSPRSKGFVGYGDADPSNVSSSVHGAEMRVAETRAVNRALRKAYGIGLCSVEELGWSPRPSGPDRSQQGALPTSGNNGHENGQPRLRDQLCLLIRKHQLDAGLVKAYAVDYCGTPALRDATKNQIESFVAHLADWAARDRDALLCKLNSFTPTPEVHL